MKIVDLQQYLDSRNVHPRLYSLAGGLPWDAFCISKEPDAWYVYFSERGTRFDLTPCKTEEEACDCFLRMIEP